MENFNKVLSFVLGLVVVVVFIIVLSNRLNIGDKLIPFKSTSPTVTKAVGQKTSPTPTSTVKFYPGQNGQTKGEAKTGTIKTIPATGSPTVYLLLVNSALALGIYLRRKSS